MTAVVLILFAAPALAHVTVDPESAPRGSSATLTFHVPNEEESADTVKVEVKIPDAIPMTSVTATAPTGWVADVQQADRVVSWSGGTIPPDQSESFAMTLGPLPRDTDSLSFPTVQTYSDGTEVQWIQETPEGGPEPDRPVPVVTLTEAVSSGSDGSTTTATSDSSSTTHSDDHGHGDSDDDNKAPVIAAVVIALVALGAVGYALYRRQRTT